MPNVVLDVEVLVVDPGRVLLERHPRQALPVAWEPRLCPRRGPGGARARLVGDPGLRAPRGDRQRELGAPRAPAAPASRSGRRLRPAPPLRGPAPGAGAGRGARQRRAVCGDARVVGLDAPATKICSFIN